jgi:Domain of unknown function (DUF4118)
MSSLDRYLQRLVRDVTLGPPTRPPRDRPETIEPGERTRQPANKRIIAYALAVALPAITAALLIPLRQDHTRTLAIIMVVPVVAVALLGATGPALTAAVAAGLAYDVLLTQPYHHIVIDDTDELIAAVTLIAVGLAVGVLSSRLVRLTARASIRRDEISHLADFAGSTARGGDLVDEACRHITEILDLQSCRWQPGHHGGDGPVLLDSGGIMGYLTSLNPDQATLPRGLELTAMTGDTEIGRFILSPKPGHVTSLEERRTAATIATIFARYTSQAANGIATR